MPDIFISYSRKDSDQALTLADKLREHGMSVWIDQHGIGGATSWSKEIVKAIDDCKAFLVLLSGSSIESQNVTREVSLASESNKRILPIAIEDIRLNDDLRYHLAGIQRVAYTEFDAIAKALNSFGITREESFEKKRQDKRKSLLVMPLDDLSPTQDNLWFADGLASELIDKLSHVRALRVVDSKTTRDLRHTKLSTYEVATTLDVRYLIQGSVRKFDDQIKISVSLFDVKESDYLWQESHKGVLTDIFELQETIADKVIHALKLHIKSEEIRALSKNRTSNPEAYALWMRGREYFSKYTRESLELAIVLFQEALTLDPEYVSAMCDIVNTECSLYVTYDPAPARLVRGEAMIARVQDIEGESARVYQLRSRIWKTRKDVDKAIENARLSIQLDPSAENSAYDILGLSLSIKDDFQGAAEALECRANTTGDVRSLFVYLVSLVRVGDRDRLTNAAIGALQVFERHMKLNPDDFYTPAQYAVVLSFAGREDEAHKYALSLMNSPLADGIGLCNIAILLSSLGDTHHALQALKRCVELGYADLHLIQNTPLLDPLRTMPEYIELMQQLEDKIEVAQHA